MRSTRLKLAALAAGAALAGALFPISPAAAQTTYEIEFGQDFFESARVPGFSARFYPGSVRLHQGDTLHFFGFGAPTILPEGAVPQEEIERRGSRLDDRFYILDSDPDEGDRAVKFNLALDGEILNCGTQDNPCVMDGSENQALAPHFTNTELYVTIDAAPGSVFYAVANYASFFRIEVVGDGEQADSQTDLFARGAELKDQDYNRAVALHAKYSAKQTKHKTAAGTTVWDAYAGVDDGPISLLAMYPKRLNIRKGDRVMFHFPLEGEIHNVLMPKGPAFDVLNNTFVPLCDPDGDQGTEPDVEAGFNEETGEPICPEGATVEFDIDERGMYVTGNGTLTGPNDLESSGFKSGDRLTPAFHDELPWTVKIGAKSPEKGWRFFCGIHGPFMGGKIFTK